MPRDSSPSDLLVISGGFIHPGLRLDPSGNLDEDCPCVRCGYELRGLPVTGACPECGCPVKRSLMGDLLEYSDRAYVAGLHRGCVGVLTGLALRGAAVIALFALGMRGNNDEMFVVLSATLLGVMFLADLVSMGGYWVFSRPDPDQITTNTGQRARQSLRIAVIGGMTTAVFMPMTLFLPQIRAAVWLAYLAVTAVQFFAVLTYVRWLGARIPSPAIHEQAGVLRWLIPAFAAAGPCTSGLTIVIAYVLYGVLFNRVRRVLKGLREDQVAVSAKT